MGLVCLGRHRSRAAVTHVEEGESGEEGWRACEVELQGHGVVSQSWPESQVTFLFRIAIVSAYPVYVIWISLSLCFVSSLSPILSPLYPAPPIHVTD